MATSTVDFVLTGNADVWAVSIGDKHIGMVWLGLAGWQYTDQPEGTATAAKEDAAQLLVYAHWKAQKEQTG